MGFMNNSITYKGKVVPCFDSFEEADDYVKFVKKGPSVVFVNFKPFKAEGCDLFIPLPHEESADG